MCKETFLEDVVRVQVYKSGTPAFTLPACIPNITDMTKGTLPTAVVDVHLWDKDGEVSATGGNAFTVKQSVSRAGSKVIYIYNVEFTAQNGIDSVADGVDSLMKDDHNIVLTKADGTLLLAYELAGTFQYEHTRSARDLQIKMSLKSYNDYIRLT